MTGQDTQFEHGLPQHAAGVCAVACLIGAFVLLVANPASGDPLALPPGQTPAADQLGHVFLSVCAPTVPALMEERIELAETAFGWQPADLGTNAAYQTPDGAITVTLDGNAQKATCEMTIPATIGGDGAALYEDLEAHLIDAVGGEEPEATFVDGGLVWIWQGDVPFGLNFTEMEGAFTLTLTAGGS